MRKQRWKRASAAVLAVLMSVALPMEAWAATEGQMAAAPEKAPVQTETTGTEQAVTPAVDATGTEVAYVDATGAAQTAANVTAVTASDTEWKAGWYVANGDITIGSRVTVNGDVHLILADGCKLTASSGIAVANGNSLAIYGQTVGSGALVADADSEGDGGISAAAIGGSDGADAGHITINGGGVTATGGTGSAGIGGGDGVYGGTIVINGGEVIATGGFLGAGIGGGMQSTGADITINGGKVTANGGACGAGIGEGMAADPNGVNPATITITGGTVFVRGGKAFNEQAPNGAAGIGGGAKMPAGQITITGGTVTAFGADDAPGIGHGAGGTSGGTISISGGNVTAYGGTTNPSISCKNDVAGGQEGQIIISGGFVTANSMQDTNGPTIRGPFSTGSNGNAYIEARYAGIADKSNQKSWSGIIVDGPSGKVYGTQTLPKGANIALDVSLTIPSGSTLTISEGATLALYSKMKPVPVTVTVTIEEGASLINNGLITGEGTLKGAGTITGYGAVDTYIEAPAPAQAEVVFADTTATYGESVTLTAKVVPAQDVEALTRVAARGKMSFYLQTEGNRELLGTATADQSGVYALTIPVSGDKGFKVGKNTIAAVYGGDMSLATAEKTAILTVKERPQPPTGGGSSSGTTVTKPDGSTVTTQKNPATGTVTETTKRPDGSSTIVETQKDGATTTTNKTPSGTTGTVATDKNGQVTKVEGNVSGKDVAQSQQNNKPVKLPVVVPVTPEGEKAPQIDINVPKDSGTIKVEIPVKNPTGGTVAVIVKPNGEKVPVKESVVTKEGLIVPLDGSSVIQIVDRSKHFADVHDAGHWAKDAVDFVTARDLFCGTSATQFSPDLSMTRGMLVAVLYRMEGSPALPDENMGYPFGDVTTSDWYGNAVYWARHHGIVSGYSDGRFGPNDTMSREQMVAILYRYAQYKGSDTTDRIALDNYTDAAQVSAWAKDAMSWANAQGIVSGTTATTLSPKGSATRAQVASILTRFCGQAVK